MKKPNSFNKSAFPFLSRICLTLCLAMCLSLFVGCDDISDLLSFDINSGADETGTNETTGVPTEDPTEDINKDEIPTKDIITDERPTESTTENEIPTEAPTVGELPTEKHPGEEDSKPEEDKPTEPKPDDPSVSPEPDDPTPDDPGEEPPFIDESEISISNAEELFDIVRKLNNNEISNDVTIHLRADIDLQDIPFTPIYEFRGTFNGHGYKISNVNLALDGATIVLSDGNWVNYTVTAIGFFGSVYDASIYNLVLENVSANFETDKEIFVGALIGYAVGVEVDSCSVSTNMDVSVTHKNVGSHNISGVAGLIGYSLDAYVQHTTVTCNINYYANSYESFTGAMLGVGNVRIYSCLMYIDISFTGTVYGHTGSVVGMERTPDGITITNMYGSIVSGNLYINNPRGYDWGAVGQGYFYDPETGNIQKLDKDNRINVEKTYG